MPKLTKPSSKRRYSVTAKLTKEEYSIVSAAAERVDMRLSALARHALLASAKLSPSERLLLAKSCKIEAMLQLLFGGLFAQMNDNKPFEKEHFRQALETAEALQFRKADEHLLKHGSMSAEVIHA